MSKYIDAEKLIAEIERRKDKYDPHWTNAGRELEELISFTKSLQQEQPQVADASKMERLNVDDLHEWSMRYAPGFREMIEATAYHFWNLAISARKEQPDMNIEWFRLAEDYTMHLDFSYCKTCDWMLHIWKKGCGANGEDLIIFNEQDTNPNLLLAKGENALKKWLLDNNINAALTPR